MVTTMDTTVKFDAFAEEHEQLEVALGELQERLAQRRDASAAIATLNRLGEYVRLHFAHEEQNDGFFDSVVDQAPRLQSRAAALIDEHAVLDKALTEIQQLAANAAADEDWWRELNLRFAAFWDLFCHHERAEIDLVQEAFHDDIGTAD